MLLFGSLASLSVVLLFQYRPATINKLDRKIVSTYVNHYRNKLESARVQTQKSQSLKQLEELLAELETIQKRDRLAVIKRNSLDQITEAYLESAEYEKALFWAETWVSFDERDILASIRLCKTLYEIPERKREALATLEALLKKVPEAELVSQTAAGWALEEGRTLDAFQIAKRHIERTYSGFDIHWTVFWDTGAGFNASQSSSTYPAITGQNNAKFEFELPKNVARIRLDPPPNAVYAIKNPVFMWQAPTGGTQPLLDLKLQLHQMERKYGGLETTGGNDPHFHWRMPESFSAKNHVAHFETQLENPLPEWIRELVTGRYSPQLNLAIADHGNDDLSEFYVQTKAALTSDINIPPSNLAKAETISISVYWSGEQKFFSEKRATTKAINMGSDKHFNAEYSINSSLKKLRLDFPDSAGAKVLIENLRLLDETSTVDVDLINARYVLMHNVSRAGNTFSLHGKDPHFAIKIDEMNVDSVLIQGQVH